MLGIEEIFLDLINCFYPSINFFLQVNAKDAEGKTPLHLAVTNQNARITSLLLCHPQLDLSVRDKSGLTPFAAALTCRNNKAAQAILDRLPSAAEQVF